LILPALKPGGPAMLFRIFGGCRTRPAALWRRGSNSFAVPKISAFGGFGIPENAQAPLPKINIRSQHTKFIL